MRGQRSSLIFVFLFLVILGASIVSITAVAGVVPEAKPAILWTVAVVMAATLPAILVKPFNLALLKAMGGTAPDDYGQPLLASLGATSIPRGGRPLLLTRADSLFSDIGFHAVTLPHVALELLTVDELRALLAQRVRRQENLVSLMLGLCVWAAIPLALGFALAFVTYQVVRAIGKVANGVADGMKPKSEGGAAVGLLLYAAGFVAFVFALVAGAVILFQALIAAGLFAVSALAFRLADLRTTADVAALGEGGPLRSALVKLDDARPRPGVLRKVFSVRAPLEAHLRQIPEGRLS